MPRAAAVYCRISDDREGRQLGVTRQREDCLALAQRKGWTVAEVYVDNDVSAYSGKPRPAFRRMLRDLKEGPRDSLIVYDLDRLVRQPRELEEFFDVCDAAGLTDYASVSGDLDLANDDHRTYARIMGALAQKESNDKRRRIRRKHQELAEQGKVSGGGTRPYGYTDDRRRIRASEAKVIREAARRVLAGESIRSVCRDLNERGLTTVTGKPWQPSGLRRVLVSARISGQREHHGEIVAPAEWPPIITPEDTAKLRVLLDASRRGASRAPRRYLLAGMLRCHACEATLVSRPRSDGERRYVCATGPGFPGCGKTAILAPPLEVFIAEAVLERLDTPELEAGLRGEAAQDAEAAAIQSDLDQAVAKLKELAAMWAASEITRAEWLAARGPIRARIDQLGRDLSRATRSTALSDYIGKAATLRREWEHLDLSRQRPIVEALLDHVIIGPGRRGFNRFDPGRVQPVWKF
jgi:DNA invertase Pin-like site-specific DNA recombinase